MAVDHVPSRAVYLHYFPCLQFVFNLCIYLYFVAFAVYLADIGQDFCEIFVTIDALELNVLIEIPDSCHFVSRWNKAIPGTIIYKQG